ncbi:MAG: tRNA (N(6)-L-threonylcarbamoyladenosine(37)-C(2))-methylthiotransferase MtaB, partial [Smithellaceae bacterium]
MGVATLGCKVNRYESAALEEYLRRKNFSVVPFNSVADVYIINTCTVTAFSDFQSRQLIRRAHRRN